MPFRFEFDSTNRILRSRFCKEVTEAELTDCYRLIAILSEALRPEAGVADFSEATATFSSETVRKLAKLPPAMPEPNHPRFIVAASDHIFGLARMFQIEGEATRPNLYVVRSERDVWETLGVDGLEFDSAPKSSDFSPPDAKEDKMTC